MRLLIVAATTPEIRPLTEKLIFIDGSGKISQWRYHVHEIDILTTGVGIVPTAYQLTKLLGTKKYDLAINAGICGSFHPKPAIGEVVNISEDFFSEVGAEDKAEFFTVFELGLDDPEEFPFSGGRLITKTFPDIPPLKGLQKVLGTTVNTVHGRKSSIDLIIRKFNPDTESMEGAAFMYCCLMESLPCLQIRAVSNRVEERNRSHWNLELAFRNLNKTLLNILKEL